MRSADESFCLYCKVTTFADGNHTLAYVGEFFLRKMINFDNCLLRCKQARKIFLTFALSETKI